MTSDPALAPIAPEQESAFLKTDKSTSPEPASAPVTAWRPHGTFTQIVLDVPYAGPISMQLTFESAGSIARTHAQRGEARFHQFEERLKVLSQESPEFASWRSANHRAAELIAKRAKLKSAVAREQDASDEAIADDSTPLDDAALAASLDKVSSLRAKLAQVESALPGVKELEAERASQLHQRIKTLAQAELQFAQNAVAADERAALMKLIADGDALNKLVEARVAANSLSYSMSAQSVEQLTLKLVGRIPDYIAVPEPPKPERTVDMHSPPIDIGGPIPLKVR